MDANRRRPLRRQQQQQFEYLGITSKIMFALAGFFVLLMLRGMLTSFAGTSTLSLMTTHTSFAAIWTDHYAFASFSVSSPPSGHGF